MPLSTEQAAALLSAWVYRGSSASPPPGFALLDVPAPNGLAAAAYQNTSTGQIFVVARGTTISAPSDVVADLGIGSNELPSWVTTTVNEIPGGAPVLLAGSAQFDRRVDLMSDFVDQVQTQYQGSDIVLAGHSLGGAVAQAVGADTGFRTYTFNAPEVAHYIQANYPDADLSGIHNYQEKGDLVSLVGETVGTPISVDGLKIVPSPDSTGSLQQFVNAPSWNTWSNFVSQPVDWVFEKTDKHSMDQMAAAMMGHAPAQQGSADSGSAASTHSSESVLAQGPTTADVAEVATKVPAAHAWDTAENALSGVFGDNDQQLDSFLDKAGIKRDTPIITYQTADGQTAYSITGDPGHVLDFTLTTNPATGAVHAEVFDGRGWQSGKMPEVGLTESVGRNGERSLGGGTAEWNDPTGRDGEGSTGPYKPETGDQPNAAFGLKAEYNNSFNQVTDKSIDLSPDGSGRMLEQSTTLGTLKGEGFAGVKAKPDDASVGGSIDAGALADSASIKYSTFGAVNENSDGDLQQKVFSVEGGAGAGLYGKLAAQVSDKGAHLEASGFLGAGGGASFDFKNKKLETQGEDSANADGSTDSGPQDSTTTPVAPLAGAVPGAAAGVANTINLANTAGAGRIAGLAAAGAGMTALEAEAAAQKSEEQATSSSDSAGSAADHAASSSQQVQSQAEQAGSALQTATESASQAAASSESAHSSAQGAAEASATAQGESEGARSSDAEAQTHAQSSASAADSSHENLGRSQQSAEGAQESAQGASSAADSADQSASDAAGSAQQATAHAEQAAELQSRAHSMADDAQQATDTATSAAQGAQRSGQDATNQSEQASGLAQTATEHAQGAESQGAAAEQSMTAAHDDAATADTTASQAGEAEQQAHAAAGQASQFQEQAAADAQQADTALNEAQVSQQQSADSAAESQQHAEEAHSLRSSAEQGQESSSAAAEQADSYATQAGQAHADAQAQATDAQSSDEAAATSAQSAKSARDETEDLHQQAQSLIDEVRQLREQAVSTAREAAAARSEADQALDALRQLIAEVQSAEARAHAASSEAAEYCASARQYASTAGQCAQEAMSYL